MGGSWFGFDRFSSRLCEKMIFYCVPWEISLFNLFMALHALRNMTKKIQLSFLTLYVLYFDAKLDLLFPTGNTWLEVGWNSFSSFAESWQDVKTFLIFLSIEPRQCKHFKNWENLHQPTWSGSTWSGWGKLFNRKRAFYPFPPRRSKTSPDDKMRKSGCSIGWRVFFVYSKSLGKVEWNFWRKNCEEKFDWKKK